MAEKGQRAEVIRATDNSKVTVRYFDYGNSEDALAMIPRTIAKYARNSVVKGFEDLLAVLEGIIGATTPNRQKLSKE